MSEHTKGLLVVKSDWLIPANQVGRPIGCSSNKERDRDHYVNVIATVSKKYHDQAANARRLAAAWNACEGMTTDAIEALAGIGSLGDLKASERGTLCGRIEYLEALIKQQDAWLGKRPCQNSRCNELNAARALLREVYEEGNLDIGDQVSKELDSRIHSHLDTFDKPGAPDAS